MRLQAFTKGYLEKRAAAVPKSLQRALLRDVRGVTSKVEADALSDIGARFMEAVAKNPGIEGDKKALASLGNKVKVERRNAVTAARNPETKTKLQELLEIYLRGTRRGATKGRNEAGEIIGQLRKEKASLAAETKKALAEKAESLKEKALSAKNGMNMGLANADLVKKVQTLKDSVAAGKNELSALGNKVTDLEGAKKTLSDKASRLKKVLMYGLPGAGGLGFLLGRGSKE